MLKESKRTMIKIAIIYGRVPAVAGLRAWVVTCLLLIVFVLTSCSGVSSSTDSPASTPLALPASKITPTVIPSSPTTDWTTYHRDNTRAGSVANTPDPHSLARTWSTQLDGAVYSEPLVIGTHVFIATEGDSVYSLDNKTGKVQ